MTQREIKFRAFDDGKMVYQTSSLVEFGILYGIRRPDAIIMQFTGCKDINGVEIYEGDYNEVGEVVIWCDECHGWQFGGYDIDRKWFYIKCHNCDGNFMFYDLIDEFKIKSNIYENK